MGHSRIGSPGCQAPLTPDESKPMTREFCFDDPRAGDIAYLTLPGTLRTRLTEKMCPLVGPGNEFGRSGSLY